MFAGRRGSASYGDVSSYQLLSFLVVKLEQQYGVVFGAELVRESVASHVEFSGALPVMSHGFSDGGVGE